jgi:dienelactone hydrolase
VVLRYEKRTRFHAQKITSQLATLTVEEETIEDVLLALDVLQQQTAVDAQHLFVLGHSLGGYLLPRILKVPTANNVRGGIILAGSARPLEDVILDQMTYIRSRSSETPESKQQLETLVRQVARVKDPSLSPDVQPSELPLNVPAAYWLDLRGYQSEQVARSLPQPLLILQAANDFQVTQDDFQLWRQALAERPDVTFKEYPNLYHLFLSCEPGKKATPVSYSIPGRVAEEVINDISHWIKRHEIP